MLFFDLPDDITITILQRLMPSWDEESGMGEAKDINAARATSTKMRVLIDEGMASFWEALCKRAWGFQRQPWWGMNAMHLPTNRLPPPWSNVFRFSLQVLERSPLRFVKNKSEEVQSYVLPAHMLLQRTVRLIKTFGWTDARDLILSVLGLCMVRVEEAHRAGYADAVRGVLEVLSGFVDGVGVAWQEVMFARARYMPGTTHWRDYRATEDHKRLLSTLKMEWGDHGDGDIFDAVDELPELLRKGYDVTLDDEIIQLVSNCTHPYVNQHLPADMQWSSAFVRVDELMTPNYGIHLTLCNEALANSWHKTRKTISRSRATSRVRLRMKTKSGLSATCATFRTPTTLRRLWWRRCGRCRTTTTSTKSTLSSCSNRGTMTRRMWSSG